MATKTTITELRNMPLADLRREVRGQRALLAKMKISIELGKEKNTGQYRREKSQLARMLTVVHDKECEERTLVSNPAPATA